jgi:parallel beta-helix repeat protein
MSAKLRYHTPPATLVLLAVVVAVTVLGLLTLNGAEAANTQPKCGDTITADTTLDSDLLDCPNNGILIGADGITLDLNGHTIDGDGTPAAGCDPMTEFCDVGVGNDGHDGVTVMHGSMRQFGGGVNIFGKVRHNRLLDISASRNRFVGIQLFKASQSLVKDSSGDDSTHPHDGTGLGLFDCHRVRVLHSSVRHNAGDHGMVTIDSNHNLIKGNLFSHNGGEGLLMEGGERNRIRRNRLIRNDGGITLGPGSHNVIAHNRISRGRDGIRIEKGHDNLVENNVVVDNGRAGIRLGISKPFIGGADNVIRGNLVKDSRVDGFLVNAKDNHSLLRHNTARGAGDDGFDVQSSTTKLIKNRAVRNGDLGIEARRGVTDGGGNRASRNGDKRQCVNVKCH